MGRLGDNPHIVAVHDVSKDSADLYLVVQYMSGGDLQQRLTRAQGHRLELSDALRIAEEVCAGLGHAHECGVVHRDIKPGNIWFDGEDRARLGDFGLARAVDRTRITRLGMMVGTAAYMAPEQAMGGTVTARSDLYALGSTLYEMLTGRPAFVGDDAVAVISQHINTPAVKPSWHSTAVPRPIDELVLKRWLALAFRSSLAMESGDFAEAERLAGEALELGLSASPENDFQFNTAQRFMIRLNVGGMEELRESLKRAARDFAGAPGWRAILASALAESGLLEEARREFEFFARDDFEPLPRDGIWMGMIGELSSTCVLLGDLERAARL